MNSSSMGMNFGAFVWWQGVIVDIKDPLNAGRVRVRIFGYHDEDESSVKNAELPWSMAALPTTSAGISGEGESHGLLQGSWVIGFFLDGNNAQIPVVLFSLPGLSGKGVGGFADPDGVYPKSPEGEPDTNRLYRGDRTAPEYKNRLDNHVPEIQNSENSKSYVPQPKINKGYKNKVIARHGNVLELDGDESNPRISLHHRHGSYIELLPNGNVVMRVIGNMYTVVDGDYSLKSRNVNISTGKFDIVASASAIIKTITCKIQTSAGNIMMESGGFLIKAVNSLKIAGSKIFLN